MAGDERFLRWFARLQRTGPAHEQPKVLLRARHRTPAQGRPAYRRGRAAQRPRGRRWVHIAARVMDAARPGEILAGGAQEVTVSPYEGSSLDTSGSYSGRAVGTVQIDQPGRLLLRTDGQARTRELATDHEQYCPATASPQARALAQRSALAGDGDVERVADLTHPFVAEPADALDERPDRHALD